MIDQQHLDTVFKLHWLRMLLVTSSIPELLKWQGHISTLFREKATKLQPPAKTTKIHPLASSGKDEAVTTLRHLGTVLPISTGLLLGRLRTVGPNLAGDPKLNIFTE